MTEPRASDHKLQTKRREAHTGCTEKQKKSLFAISAQWVRLKIKWLCRACILDGGTEAALTRSFNKINTLQTLGRNEKLTSAHRQTGTCSKCAMYEWQNEGKKPWFL